MKNFTMNMPVFASAIGAAEGMSFDVDVILETVVGVFLGTTDIKDVPADMIEEVVDVIKEFSHDAMGTSMKVAGGAILPMVSFKAIGFLLEAMHLPKRRKFGPVTLVWAI